MKTTQLSYFNTPQEAIHSLFGGGVRISETHRISGGDINDAYGLKLTEGSRIFMKRNKGQGKDFFLAEAEGLSALAQTNAIGTPHVLCYGKDFLLMEYIEGGDRVLDYWENFGCQLAAVHRADTTELVEGGAYGFVQDNYIGAGKQINTPRQSWIDFFRDCRLKPQFKRAWAYFDLQGQIKSEKLLGKLEDILVEPEYPSLLHGDLWSGNVITGNDGKAWLIDPAVSVGHREADLAMTELFGRFPQTFYDTYEGACPLQPGYERRKELYNLYHLLNHLNLFGRSYLPAVRRVIGTYV